MNTLSEEAIRRASEKLRQRIERVRDVVRVYDSGQISEGKAVGMIADIASGDADAIVRVGGKQHQPEIQT